MRWRCILLREGLEAILVLAAIIAFVAKTGRRDALPWRRTGWIVALALGALTWVAATFFVQISGANREVTEGVSALLAAAMLLYVGYWLHGKSYAHAWSHFIRAQVGGALARRTLWAMAGVSFLAVYREMLEIVLFYQALWLQAGAAGRSAVLAGILNPSIMSVSRMRQRSDWGLKPGRRIIGHHLLRRDHLSWASVFENS